jgi:hypothetical protein
MLPLGRLALGARDSRFTPDEQHTLMTLWSTRDRRSSWAAICAIWMPRRLRC